MIFRIAGGIYLTLVGLLAISSVSLSPVIVGIAALVAGIALLLGM